MPKPSGTPHSSLQAGRVAAWRHHELAGPVPPGWGSPEPWSSVSVLHALPFPWSQYNRTAAPWSPPGILFQNERQAGRGGVKSLGSLEETAKPLGTNPGPTLGVEKASQSAPPGRSEDVLTCQESQLQRSRPSFVGLFGTSRLLGIISVNFHLLPKGLLLLREREAHPKGHPPCQRQGQIWNSKPQGTCSGLLSPSLERPVSVV